MLDFEKQIGSHLDGVKRVVVKVGTAVLSHPRTRFNHVVVHQLGDEIALLRMRGLEVILVSSGAVGLGMRAMGVREYPNGLPERQACAALGQGELMGRYRDVFSPYGIRIGQILLTRQDLEERNAYLNARNAIRQLLDWGILPIINQNDTTATEELAFGDNDALAALVTGKMGAHALVLLTTVDGFYRDWSSDGEPGELVRAIDVDDDDTFAHACGPDSPSGLGGMTSKVSAARMVASFGALGAIGNGRRQGILTELLSGKGKGTYILPRQSEVSGGHTRRLSGRKHWIAFGKRASGVVIVDSGAQRALVEGGKSLLPSGVVGVAGGFRCEDLVEVHDEAGREFARGLVNFSGEELGKLVGRPSSDIRAIFGGDRPDEVIHRDNMVLL